MSQESMDYAPEYILRLQQEHAEVIDELLLTHLLWNPKVELPQVPPTEMAFVTIVVLNDGRTFHVQTIVSTAETSVSPNISEKQRSD